MQSTASEAAFGDLVGAIYDAALDRSQWQSVLELLVSSLDACGGTLLFNEAGGNDSVVVARVGVDPAHVEPYDRYYFQVDPSIAASRRLSAGTVISTDRLLSEAAWRRTEFFSDFLRHLDVFHVSGSKLLDGPGVYSAFGLHRSYRRGPLDREEKRFLETLTPHLSRALEIHRRVAVTRHEAEVLEGTLDRLRLGVVLLSADGRVLELNREARRIMDLEDGLLCLRRELLASTPSETARLRSLFGACPPSGGLGACNVLRLARPSGRRPFEVLVAPVRAGRAASPGASVALFITDPERADHPQRQLRDLYELTDSEAAVCELLMQGYDLRQISERRNVALATTRTQIKSILSKTGARRQAQLVSLLLKSPIGSVREGST